VSPRARTSRRGSRPQHAVPPPDNPLAREQSRTASRQAGQEDLDLLPIGDGMRVAVTAAAMAPPPERRTRARSTPARMAELRLAALQETGRHPSGDSTVGALAAGAPSPVAPVPGASNWTQLGPNAIPKGQTYGGGRVLVTGRVTAIAVDPTDRDRLFVGTAQGGVWRSTDRGDQWQAMTDNAASLAIGALTIDPNNHQTIYAGSGEANFSQDSYYGAGILKSTDGGTTWTQLGAATFVGLRIARIAVTPGTANRVFAATGGGLYRSTDGGTTWTRMTGTPLTAATDVTIDPSTATTVVASFWGGTIYRSTNAGAGAPTWTQLAGGLPTTGVTRVALGRAPSNSLVLFALTAGPWNANPALAYLVNGLYRSTDGGTTWTAVPLPGGNIGGQGFYNLNVAFDPTTPDIAYISGVSLWKAVRNPSTGTWSFTDIGGAFHPDNHALAFDPTDHQTIYAGSDGGIYRSTNGGSTWDDSINRDLCLTQFEFIAQHPASDAVVLGGTQDNGTEQFRNSPVFYHSDDGDGGFCLIDQTQPRNFLSTYYSNSPKRSTQAGRMGTWMDVSGGIAGAGLFYPPLAADRTNQNNVAFGTDQINLDGAQGTGGWPTKIPLPGLATGSGEVVSAISYVSSSLIYVGTSLGKVYRLVQTGGAWAATAIQAAPLPSRYIWDIAARPGAPDTIFVVMSGFGTAHVWRGVVGGAGTATWTDASGTGGGQLPDIPANALVIDPAAADTMYVATDVAVFRTTDGGATWSPFSEGLPNCAVFDMDLHAPTRLLRAATHGRGLWERKLDTPTAADVRLFVRDHLMDTGRASPSVAAIAAAFDDPLQGVMLGDPLWWWQCADIKVDALEGSPPAYQMPVAAVDYVAFESALEHRKAQRGRVNRIYVQVHNQGISPALNVAVKVLWADASAGLPALPPDFWTAFPGNSTNTTDWHPVGAAQTIPSLPPYLPAVLEWDWNTPVTAATHSCLLTIVDSASDPIAAGSKVFVVNTLVHNERRCGLRNLHVVDAPPGTIFWTELGLRGRANVPYGLRLLPHRAQGWSIGFVLPRAMKQLPVEGITVTKPTAAVLKQLRARLGQAFDLYDTSRIYTASTPKGARLSGIKLTAAGARVLLMLTAPPKAAAPKSITVVQESAKGVVGGCTYVLRARKAGG
jgi:photosystem II stability/assembly factor-like uncharacterized protein